MDKQTMIDKIYKIVGEKTMLYNWKLQEITNPVMIGDVLDWRMLKQPIEYWWEKEWIEILRRWWLKREPLEKQSEECILFIYNLINEL